MSLSWVKTGTFTRNEEFNNVCYRNNASGHLINGIDFINYFGNSFQIIVKARDSGKYQIIKQAIVSAGFEPPDFSDRDSNLIRIRSSNLPFLKKFVDTLQTTEPSFGTIKQDFYGYLNIDPTQEYVIPTWMKEGDFSLQNISSDVPLIKKVEYKNTVPHHHIKQISLLAYRSGSYQIILEAKNQEKYQIIKQAIVSAGFERPDSLDSDRNLIRIQTSNISLLKKFIDAIQVSESSFGLIQQEFYGYLNINPTQEYIVPTWIKEGNFTQILNYGFDVPLNREVKFRNTVAQHYIKEVSLCGYRSGNYQIIVEAKNVEKYETLKQSLVNAGFQPDPTDAYSKTIRLRTSNFTTISNFMNAIANVDIQFEPVRQQICGSLGITPTVLPSTVPQLNTLLATNIQGQNTSQSIQGNVEEQTQEQSTLQTAINESFSHPQPVVSQDEPPKSSQNAQKVEELKIPDEDIPEEFLCKLTAYIMTDPCYDPKVEPIKFEKSQILHWLKLKKTNPFTGLPLVASKLVPDNVLKAKIDEYLKKEEDKRKISLSK